MRMKSSGNNNADNNMTGNMEEVIEQTEGN